jgi:2-phosphoglycerate kinase
MVNKKRKMDKFITYFYTVRAVFSTVVKGTEKKEVVVVVRNSWIKLCCCLIFNKMCLHVAKTTDEK